MNKRILRLLCCIIIYIGLSGCKGHRISLNIQAEEINNAELFTGSVPADAQKKEITGGSDIQIILDEINRLSIERTATDEDAWAGGIGLFIRFNMTDGSSVVFHLDQHTFTDADGKRYIVRENNIAYDLYAGMDCEAIPVGEDGLPSMPSA